jgi:hypothetical protein
MFLCRTATVEHHNRAQFCWVCSLSIQRQAFSVACAASQVGRLCLDLMGRQALLNMAIDAVMERFGMYITRSLDSCHRFAAVSKVLEYETEMFHTFKNSLRGAVFCGGFDPYMLTLRKREKNQDLEQHTSSDLYFQKRLKNQHASQLWPVIQASTYV